MIKRTLFSVFLLYSTSAIALYPYSVSYDISYGLEKKSITQEDPNNRKANIKNKSGSFVSIGFKANLATKFSYKLEFDYHYGQHLSPVDFTIDVPDYKELNFGAKFGYQSAKKGFNLIFRSEEKSYFNLNGQSLLNEKVRLNYVGADVNIIAKFYSRSMIIMRMGVLYKISAKDLFSKSIESGVILSPEVSYRFLFNYWSYEVLAGFDFNKVRNTGGDSLSITDLNLSLKLIF